MTAATQQLSNVEKYITFESNVVEILCWYLLVGFLYARHCTWCRLKMKVTLVTEIQDGRYPKSAKHETMRIFLTEML